MDKHEALNYIIPFGKFKGSTVDDLFSTREGVAYLNWMIENNVPKGKLKEAIDYIREVAFAAKNYWAAFDSIAEIADVVMVLEEK